MSKYDCLRIENQLCFPLYACSKAVTRHYKPFLDKYDLTYTQYITMMVMWDKKKTSVKELGEKLYLDSGTLTPVINKLESKGYIIKNRSKEDARGVDVELTDKGFRLQDDILSVPADMGKCVNISDEDAKQLYRILYTILDNLDKKE